MSWLKMLRVHQWAKNLLVLVPLVAGHRLGDGSRVLAATMAFFAFSFAASSVYIVNDLIDLPSDRAHPTKKRRPLASGKVSLPGALAAIPFLLCGSIGVGALLPVRFLQLLLIYLATATAYTFYFKKKLLIDVLCLAGLYTLRMLAGGAAINIEITTWLMAFSMFLFLSLAFVKRYSELVETGGDHISQLAGRGYRSDDLDLIRSVGPASGFLAVLVLCLYVNDPLSAALYQHPKRLWLLCPVVLYWIMRIWFAAQRGAMNSDPVVYALRDRGSLAAGVIAGAIIIAASL